MGVAVRRAPLATAPDLSPADRLEVVAGVLVEKDAATFDHGTAQGSLAAELFGPFQFGRGGGPGGWWIATEPTVEFETHEVYQPDVAGWRREHSPARPGGFPIRVRPDWVCEVLSPSTANRDLKTKLRTHHRAGVGHYWVLDPEHGGLTIHLAHTSSRDRAAPPHSDKSE